MGDLKLIEIHSELGAGTRGASMGIDALKVACLNAGSSFFQSYPTVRVEDENSMLWTETDTPNAKHIDGIAKVYGRLCNEVSHTLRKGQFPVVLAGDHASAGGTIAGVKSAFPDKRIGVIWVDAHADLHTPYTTPSGNVHGMPLASALAVNNLDCKRNELNPKAVLGWDDLKETGGISPKLKATDLVFIGVRSTEPEEEHLMEKYNIRNFKVEEVKGKGPDAVALDALTYLDNCDLIYVSFDVDSMDPGISRGTGTPVENGISAEEADRVLRRLLQHEKVCAFEVVEINPTLDDKCNTMAETAFGILERAVDVITSRPGATS